MSTVTYISKEDVKVQLVDSGIQETYDFLLDRMVLRASRLVDRICVRQPGAYKVTADSVLYFGGNGNSTLYIGEIAAVPTEVASYNTGTDTYDAWLSTDYFMQPVNNPQFGLPYTEIQLDKVQGAQAYFPNYPDGKGMRVTGKFGYSVTVPELIQEAVTIQVVRWFMRAKQGYQDAGAITELSQLTYTKKLDPDVELILADGGFIRLAL